MRKILIDNNKVLEILNKKSDLSKETQKILDRLQVIEDEGKKLEKEFNIYLGKTKLLDDKSRPHLKKIIDKIELGEYEQVSRVFQDGKDWVIEIADRMEEFKEAMKADKANQTDKK